MFKFCCTLHIGLSWSCLPAFALAVAGGMVLVAIFPVWRRRAERSSKAAEKSKQPETDRSVLPDSRIEEKEDACLTENEAAALFAERMAGLIASFTNEDLTGLFRLRMEDLEEETTDSARAAAMVSMLDELHIMEPGIQGEDLEILHRVAAAIHHELRRMGAEVLDLNEWDPQWQRAVEVRRDLPSGAAPVIAEKVESGLVLRGRLCRKQSVILRKADE